MIIFTEIVKLECVCHMSESSKGFVFAAEVPEAAVAGVDAASIRPHRRGQRWQGECG